MNTCPIKWMLTAAVVAVGTFSLNAKVVPAPIFTDNMVLQREMNVPIWGKADPGENVTVKFADQTLSTVAGQDGKWMIKLAPLTASKDNRVLEIAGKDNKVLINDVLVGEVWLCSGQSNMQFPIWGENARFRQTDGDKIAAASNNPLIRIIRIPCRISWTPTMDYDVKWMPMTPDTVKPFSAVGYFYGTELYKALNIPIGLIGSNWGGTRVEPWTSPYGFSTVPELTGLSSFVQTRIPGSKEYKNLAARVQKDNAEWLKKFTDAVGQNQLPPERPGYPREFTYPTTNAQQEPTVIYNRMIYPFVPFAMRGAIWYQGCSNRDDGMLYRYKMQALINDWTHNFENPNFKLYFVQLAPYNYGNKPDALPKIWEAQQSFANAEPRAGMAVITDVGNLKDIHPYDKTLVGKRLALLALKRDYGFKDIKADSPTLKSYEIKDGKFILTFNNVESWKTANSQPVKNFEVAGIDRAFVPADVKFDGAKLIVYSDKISDPKMLRFMWSHTCEGNLYNEADLLLGAFRIDTIDEKTIVASAMKNGQVLFQYNLLSGLKGQDVQYDVNNVDQVKGKKITRVGYWVELDGNDGHHSWMLAVMDPFSQDPKDFGVPTNVDKIFQTNVPNLAVYSNVDGVRNGVFVDGNIEFCSGNYGAANVKNIPNANSNVYDFGDSLQTGRGYGCMQIHNYREKQVVFAYNKFGSGAGCDLGIGNQAGDARTNTDWTFSSSGRNYKRAVLSVYVVTE